MARVKIYRVAEPGQNAVMHPETGHYIVPDSRHPYREDDILVVTYPWLFMSDEDTVETASANPGEKRKVGRPPLPTAAPVYEQGDF